MQPRRNKDNLLKKPKIVEILYTLRGYQFKNIIKFNCCTIEVATEQKARATYEKLINLCRDNPDVIDPLRYLRQREVVHFQRFGEALRGVQDKLAEKKFYMNDMKPLDNSCGCNND